MLHNKLLKKDTLIDQELTNKDIMFIKLNNLQNENDKLKTIVTYIANVLVEGKWNKHDACE